MDQKATYEITIAEKLEQLNVPDMVDAIWARIETQLDIDMPPDDAPAGGQSPTGGGSWRIAGIIVFVAALVATLYFTNRKPTNNNQDKNIESPATITNPGNTFDKPPPRTVTPVRQFAPATNGDALTNSPLLIDSSIDPAPDQQVPESRTDSLAVIPPVAPPVFVPGDTIGKKRRGVQGITDDDYRIVPKKKDST